jgi:molecular chaperone HscC
VTSPIVGIDLGTTGSLVAVLRDGRPEVLANSLGERITPSAVSLLEDGTVVVGSAARARASTHPGRTAVQFKREMGTEREVDLGGVSLSPVALSALVLRELKETAEERLGEPVTQAVITVPAYFGEDQRHATREAGRLAGLEVLRVVNEPTAAALAYGLDHLDRTVKVVVLDLGGGTFDVTVLELSQGYVDVRASSGDARLGGEDFSDVLLPLLLGGLTPTAGALARAREAADRAKLALTAAPEAVVQLDGLELADGPPTALRRTITRAEAEEAWLPLLTRLRAPIEQAMRDAHWRLTDVEEVLLVGGATRMPVVRRLAERLFGRAPRTDVQPDEAVALGAAVQAALYAGDAAVEELIATDVAPFSLGMEVSEQVGGIRVDGRYAPILERGTVIPASREKPFYTAEPGQERVRIRVYQGEHPVTSRNTFLGELDIDGLRRTTGDDRVRLDVRFTYDLSGLLEVDCRVEGGEPRTLVLVGSRSRLTDPQIATIRASLQRLKVHPRDLLPNATALSRAEALYAQLTGREREGLGRQITVFEAALVGQDRREIDLARRMLLDLTAALQGA